MRLSIRLGLWMMFMIVVSMNIYAYNYNAINESSFNPRIGITNNSLYLDGRSDMSEYWYSTGVGETIEGKLVIPGNVTYENDSAHYFQISPDNDARTYMRYSGIENIGSDAGVEGQFIITGEVYGGDTEQFFMMLGNGLDDTESNLSEGVQIGLTFREGTGTSNIITRCYFPDESNNILFTPIVAINDYLDINTSLIFNYKMNTTQIQTEVWYKDKDDSNRPILANSTLDGCDINIDDFNVTVLYRDRTGGRPDFAVPTLSITPKIDGYLRFGDNITYTIARPHDLENISVKWYADGVYLDDGDTYKIQYNDKDANITAVINISTGFVPGTPDSYYDIVMETPSYQVEPLPNFPPNITSGSFNQSAYTNIEDISYFVVGEDHENDKINISFRWYVDGVGVYNDTVVGGNAPQNLSSSLTYTYFSAGDNISLEIQSYDGLWSDVFFDSIEISPPQALTLTGSCVSYDIYHNIDLSCTYSVSDPDDLSWLYYVNDSDINISSDGITAHLSHDPVLSDYGCRDVTINATDGFFWDEDSFTYCVLDNAPSVSFNLAAYYLIGTNITITPTVTDPEDDPVNLSYIWTVDDVIVKTGHLYNLSSYVIYYESDNATNLDTLSLNITVSDTLFESGMVKTSIFRAQSDNFLSDNYCPDDIEGMMLLFVVFIILAFFLVIDLMITLPILGIISGFGFMGLGLIIFGCHPMMGFIVSGSGLLYFMYNIFSRQF